MKRSLKIFLLVLVGLFLLLSGVSTTLSHMAGSRTQNSFTWYNEKGETILAYNGDLNLCKSFVKPPLVAVKPPVPVQPQPAGVYIYHRM